MKTTALIFYIIGIIGLIAIMGLILMLKSENQEKGKKILSKSGYLISSLLILTFMISDMHRDYSLYKEQNIWHKYRLPQIDSNMHLSFLKSNWSFYTSIIKDSVYHSSKSIEYDLFDIYSIEDDFINMKLDKILTMKFIKPNILRDSTRLITLKAFSDYSNKLPIDTLSIGQFDSILIDWGLYNSVYQKILD